ncbi:efflux RND transporter periplasmic adaptor subunit [Actinoplanes sp. NPDC049265]|uniref:efflux RND transporter periplasmic adaptor subunit n=1 Tax=Actinoplanes sp. NPDC049265 TaxID=3363902 RepID=UPI003723B4FE
MTRRRLLVSAAVGAAVLLAVTGYAVRGRHPDAGAADEPARARSVRTTPVERTDLAVTLTLDGSLGYGSEQVVTSVAGRVTWLPRTGATVSRGAPLFRIDDRPVPLFYGNTPLFRPLDRVGLVGRDVRVVLNNLRELGYRTGRQPAIGTVVHPPSPTAAAGSTPAKSAPAPTPASTERVEVQRGDAVLNTDVMSAIKLWQGELGLPTSGVIRPGDVVVLPGRVRVNALKVALGGDATTPILSVTDTAKVVTVQVRGGEADTVRSAGDVSILLPDGSSTPGRVIDVARRATAGDDASDASGQTGQVTFSATVSVTDPKKVRGWESAPVRVEFAARARKGVLAVPVGALLATREGGYAVETEAGQLIPVTAGLFARGMVEISGPGITEGARVVTTS